MITGKIVAEDVTGFRVNTNPDPGTDDTVLRFSVGRGTEVYVSVSRDMATDLANAIRRSVSLPGTAVTATEMRDMRARQPEKTPGEER